jgi:hypothetical protein
MSADPGYGDFDPAGFPSADPISGLLFSKHAVLTGLVFNAFADTATHFDVSGILETWKFVHEH